jgi:uncharacterized coiled-coil protein SlyX
MNDDNRAKLRAKLLELLPSFLDGLTGKSSLSSEESEEPSSKPSGLASVVEAAMAAATSTLEEQRQAIAQRDVRIAKLEQQMKELFSRMRDVVVMCEEPGCGPLQVRLMSVLVTFCEVWLSDSIESKS